MGSGADPAGRYPCDNCRAKKLIDSQLFIKIFTAFQNTESKDIPDNASRSESPLFQTILIDKQPDLMQPAIAG